MSSSITPTGGDASATPEPAADATADEIVKDIEATRQHLGETIDALEDKLNVSAQAKRKVNETKTRVTDQVKDTSAAVSDKINETTGHVTERVSAFSERTRQDPASAWPAAVAALLVIALLVWRASRSSRD